MGWAHNGMGPYTMGWAHIGVGPHTMGWAHIGVGPHTMGWARTQRVGAQSPEAQQALTSRRWRSAAVSGSQPALAMMAWRCRKLWRVLMICMKPRLPVKVR